MYNSRSYPFSLILKNVLKGIGCLLFITGCKDQIGEKNKAGHSTPAVTTAVFEKIDASVSGINFANALTHNVATNENLFDFDYFYNGAGVGVEDLDNDGLLDVFFCGNQVQNKLFLNTGNLIFRDISEPSKINMGKGWSNGVTFVDINEDGWMDIYISRGGPGERNTRKNLLFINQTDTTFSEMAEQYGLADMGISTQSAFFDFDKDGDLDCIVMNETELHGVDPINLYKIVEKDEDLLYYSSSHLYRNDGGKFTDVTKKSGLLRPIFGLGLSVSDINDDGWLDIYIASDYYIPDAMFMNNGDGTFEDQIKTHTRQISYYGMGIDIADVNNDAQQDIFVLDMASRDHIRSKTLMASMNTGRFNYLVNTAGFHHQYMFNSLQLNEGGGKFSDIAQLTGTANTDWSWSALFSDLDLDGMKDLHITNGYRRYALDNDLQMRVMEAKKKYGNNVPLEVKTRLYESMPSEKLPNILFKSNSEMHYQNVADAWGMDDFTFSNGAAIGDLDNDGDLDILINNMDENAFLYKNMAVESELGNFLKVNTRGKLSESFARVRISYGSTTQLIESKRVRGYRSAPESGAHFGVGKANKIDTVTVYWPSGKMEERYNVPANSVLLFEEKNAVINSIQNKETVKPLFKKADPKKWNLNFVHEENTYDDFELEVLLPYKQSTLGPFISKGDVNNDGLEDFYIGGASGQPGELYLQTAGGFTNNTSADLKNDRGYEDMESVFFDFDGDNDLDLFVVSGGNEFEEHSSYYQDRLYINDGRGQFKRASIDALTKYAKSGKSVAVLDFDQDGDKDLLVGNRIRPKNYPNYAPSTLYENTNGNLRDVTSEKAGELLDFGIINSILVTDFNNDGWEDFIVAGEWTDIGFFQNQKGNFKSLSDKSEALKEKGWWFSINETDVNNDGLKDYVLGNVGLNLKFGTSREKPLKIYATDFDENGTNDIVLSKEYNGNYVPVRGRECSSQQMPFIKSKYPSYESFAKATLTDVFGEKLAVSYQNEVTDFRSILLLNKGNGKFEKKVLPIAAQMAPVLSACFVDLNEDGFEDCIVAGNIYETEVETPRLDAFSGTVLLSNQVDGYVTMPRTKSGIYMEGNVKDLALLKHGTKTLLLNTANNGPLGVYELEKN